MNYIPYVVFALVIVALVSLSARNRRRQAVVEQHRHDKIVVGSDVMTTSGLHGTVVAVNDDGTVQLSIAPGVEVRWEFAALRDLDSLPGHVGAAHTPHDAHDAHEPALDRAQDGAGRVDLDKRSGADPSL